MHIVDLTSAYNDQRTQHKHALLRWYENWQAQGQALGKTPAEVDAEVLAQLQGNLRDLGLLTEALSEKGKEE